MAKPARFVVGSSGSGKHTEVKGDGSELGGRPPSVSGPRIGPGAEGRVRPEIGRDTMSAARPAVKGMKRYSED